MFLRYRGGDRVFLCLYNRAEAFNNYAFIIARKRLIIMQKGRDARIYPLFFISLDKER